jgi:hypothetical protein
VVSQLLPCPLDAGWTIQHDIALGGPGGDIVFGGPGIMSFSVLIFLLLGALPAALVLRRMP